MRTAVYVPQPTYHVVAVDGGASITLHSRVIAHSNRWNAAAGGFCVRLVEQANRASDMLIALKWMVAAIGELETRGEIPETVKRAKARAEVSIRAAG